MDEVVGVLGWVCLGVASLGVLYTLAAGLALGWFMQRSLTPATAAPPVTILKPLHGLEPGLGARLASFCGQDYEGAVQIVFGVRDPTDAAIAVVRRLIADHPKLDLELVIEPRIWGSNLKISNLINMQSAARHAVMVIADSDVGVTPDYLRRLTAPLSDPRVGYATCAYVGEATENPWSRLAAMAIDHHFLPSVALGLRLGLAKPCFGPTIAFRREVLERAGGFGRFADQLADDFEIGRAIRQLGLGFVVPPLLVTHACPERDGRGLWLHELRWARTIRLIDPRCYLGSLICHPAAFALAAFALRPGVVGGSVLALVAIARLFVVWRVARLAGGDARFWWASPARDLLSLGVHIAGFFAQTVEWRGLRFHVGSGGVLRACAPRVRDPFPSAGVVEARTAGATTLAARASSAG